MPINCKSIFISVCICICQWSAVCAWKAVSKYAPGSLPNKYSYLHIHLYLYLYFCLYLPMIRSLMLERPFQNMRPALFQMSLWVACLLSTPPRKMALTLCSFLGQIDKRSFQFNFLDVVKIRSICFLRLIQSKDLKSRTILGQTKKVSNSVRAHRTKLIHRAIFSCPLQLNKWPCLYRNPFVTTYTKGSQAPPLGIWSYIWLLLNFAFSVEQIWPSDYPSTPPPSHHGVTCKLFWKCWHFRKLRASIHDSII